MSQYEISVKPGTPKRLLTSGKYCDRDIVVDAEVSLGSKTITKNGTFTAAGEGLDGFSSVSVNIVTGVSFGTVEEFTFATRNVTSGSTTYSASYEYANSVTVSDDTVSLVDATTTTFRSLDNFKGLTEKYFKKSGVIYYVPADANIREATIKGSANVTTGYKIVGNVQRVTAEVSATFGSKEITENGTYVASDDGVDGYETVFVNVPSLDTSGATATPQDMAEGVTAFVNDKEVTGELPVWDSIYWDTPTATFTDGELVLKGKTGDRKIMESGSPAKMHFAGENLGDADPSDVAAGKTFTSVSGLKVPGTRTEPTITQQGSVLVIR